MIKDEILSLLACPECKEELYFEKDELFCKKCEKIYPLKNGIILFGFNEEEKFWKDFFNNISEEKGDSEKSNAYINRRNFQFTKFVLLNAIGKLEGKRIVDIGCGTGHSTSSLSKDNTLFGVDLSFKILRYARDKGLFPLQSSATKLPLKSNYFDLVICNNLFQTIKKGEDVMDEIDRVMKKGGKLFIVTSNKDGILNKFFSLVEMEKYKKMRLYSLSEIESYLKKKNIEICNFYYLSFPLSKVWKNKKSKLIKIISNSFMIEAEKR